MVAAGGIGEAYDRVELEARKHSKMASAFNLPTLASLDIHDSNVAGKWKKNFV